MPNGTILFVDDELAILKSFIRVFRTEDCNLITANSAEEGLQIIQSQPVQVVISDQRMPNMTGAEFLSQVRKSHPHIIRIIMSGYADIHAVIECINHAHIHHFLPKPWENDELKKVVMSYLKTAQKMAETNQELQHTLVATIAEQDRELMELRLRT